MLERILALEIVRVTERAAVTAARLRGRGDEKAADQAAVDAMRREINKLPIDGTVVIGEGERDEAPMLFIGEKVGARAAQGRHRRRSAGRHDAVRQEHARRHRHHGDGRGRHTAATRPTSTWRRSRSVPAIRRTWSISTRRRTRTSARSPRRRASRPRISPRSSSIVRATPISSRRCARPAPRCA